ncbi:MAG: SIR2 family NAD-dependent protein deacylase [Pseudomonadota bacterium]|jgi:NAD-dependent deacetylase
MKNQRIVVLSGAGISAESGLGTFRGSGGLWEGVSVKDVATPEAWERDPARVLRFYNERRRAVRMAEPNEAHYALRELEDIFSVSIITQNIDDLHERAGSSHVLHLHGEIIKARSTVKGELLYDCRGDISIGDKCERGSQLRPHVVWFGEAVPNMDEAIALAKKADFFIVVGTALEVYPAASLVDYVPYEATKFVIDPVPSGLADDSFRVIATTATEGVPKVVAQLRALMA